MRSRPALHMTFHFHGGGRGTEVLCAVACWSLCGGERVGRWAPSPPSLSRARKGPVCVWKVRSPAGVWEVPTGTMAVGRHRWDRPPRHRRPVREMTRTDPAQPMRGQPRPSNTHPLSQLLGILLYIFVLQRRGTGLGIRRLL